MNMSEEVGCQISGLVDGELGDAEREFLIRRLVKDPELQRRWRDYHTIGEALKNQLPDKVSPDFALRVSEAIAQEPVYRRAADVPRDNPASPLKKIAGWAVAASIAVLGVSGVMTIIQQDASVPGPAVAVHEAAEKPLTVAQSAMQTDNTSPTLATVNTPARPLKDPRLNKYLVNHSEYAMGASVHGVLPYARIVGQQPRQ